MIDGHCHLSNEYSSCEEAMDALGEIVGLTTPDDILENIFAKFCVGK